MKKEIADKIKRGMEFSLKGELDRAEEEYKKALEISIRDGDRLGEATCYGNLCILYGMKKKYEKAKEFCLKALNIHESLNANYDIAKDYVNLGIIEKNLGNFKEAENYFKKALSIFEEHEDENKTAYVFLLLGATSIEGEDFEKAQEYFARARDIYKNLDRDSYLLACLNLADAYKAGTKLREAEKCYLEVIQSLKGEDFKRAALGLFEIYVIYALSDFNKNQDCLNNLKKAYDYISRLPPEEGMQNIIRNFSRLMRINPEFVIKAVESSEKYLGEGVYKALKPIELASLVLEGKIKKEDIKEHREIVEMLLRGSEQEP